MIQEGKQALSAGIKVEEIPDMEDEHYAEGSDDA
jgi:hypothetical protein